MEVCGQSQRFSPSVNPKAYRNALGRFATGITVITTYGPNGPSAITVNSFASVSLDPALVLWSPDKKSKRHDIFVNAEYFAVHVLAAHQRGICDGFVKSAFAFEGVETVSNEQNVPIIKGCLAVFECKKFAQHDAGDHTILIGEVLGARHRCGEALVFANGAYGIMPAA